MTFLSPRRPGAAPVSPLARPEGFGVWLRQFRFTAFSLVMLGVLILAVAVLAPSFKQYLTQQQQISDLRTTIAQQHAAIRGARKDIARWQDPAYIRAQARDRLFYVMPGEKQLLVINDATVTDAGGAKITAQATRTRSDWASGLVASGLIAGLTDKTSSDLSLVEDGQ